MAYEGIREWVRGLPEVGARVRIDETIRYLQTVKIMQFPDTRVLKGECDGLVELRIPFNKVQYRMLGFYGPQRGQFTIVLGTTEESRQLQPSTRDACKNALKRKKQVFSREKQIYEY